MSDESTPFWTPNNGYADSAGTPPSTASHNQPNVVRNNELNDDELNAALEAMNLGEAPLNLPSLETFDEILATAGIPTDQHVSPAHDGSLASTQYYTADIDHSLDPSQILARAWSHQGTVLSAGSSSTGVAAPPGYSDPSSYSDPPDYSGSGFDSTTNDLSTFDAPQSTRIYEDSLRYFDPDAAPLGHAVTEQPSQLHEAPEPSIPKFNPKPDPVTPESSIILDPGVARASTPAPADVTLADPVTPEDKIVNSQLFGLPAEQPEPEQHDPDLADFYALFASKLALSSSSDASRVLVLLSPLSYKHVFSRTWESKRYHESVVERPQRLMASALGIGSAVAACPSSFKVDVSNRRSSLLEPHVAKVHGTNWGQRLQALCAASTEKLANGNVEVPDDWNSGDIYLTAETVDAIEGVIGSSEEAVDRMLDSAGSSSHDRVFVAVRPPGHHSHPCVPSGFCLVNNVHIAIQYAKAKYDITHAVILDFDLHHGDGSQDICWKLAGLSDEDEEKEEVEDEVKEDVKGEVKDEAKEGGVEGVKVEEKEGFANGEVKKEPKESPEAAPESPLHLGYFSLHDINSFPTEFGYATADNIKNASVCLMAHGMCIWNVHLEPFDDEDDFNRIYGEKYAVLFEKARLFLRRGQIEATKTGAPFKPFIVLSAGFDSSEFELQSMQRHQVSVPTSFFNRFTRDAGVLADEFTQGKLLSMLEGGYSDAALATGIMSHLTGLAKQPWQSEWASAAIAKEYAKGCKLKWKPTASAAMVADGIQLGRSLWPQELKLKVEAASMRGSATTVRRPQRQVADQTSVLATPSRVLRDSTRRTVRDL